MAEVHCAAAPPDGQLAQILQWSAKLDGQFIRLAALMALAAGADVTEVDSDAAMRAAVLTEHCIMIQRLIALGKL